MDRQSQENLQDSIPLSRFTLYETKTRLYLVGTCTSEKFFKILKIDRTSADQLQVSDDSTLYTKQEMTELLKMIDQGNKQTGGLEKVMSAFGVVGFIRFLEGFYLVLITKRSPVALVGGHTIWHIDETAMVSVASPLARIEKKPDEAKYLQIFSSMDLSKNFYFSYTYNLTRTLQHNMTAHPPPRASERRHKAAYFDWNSMMVWNHYLLSQGFGQKLTSDWCLPIIHGFVDQAKLSIFGHNLYITLIGRRSRHFAGARFLKRGINTSGHVANEVETEQIVHDASTTSFYIGKPNYTSYVQVRGSIPLFWFQDGLNPKPPIEMACRDPYFVAAGKHFNDLFHRYGQPVIALNLVKAKEKVKRESILLDEFTACVEYLNQFLPSDKKIKYIAWDMSRASKSENEDVIATLEKLGQEALALTGFFHNSSEPYSHVLQKFSETRVPYRRQQGVLRTNCIDCLDRTNAAQFVVGKVALAHQLFALGVIEKPSLPFDCDVVNLLNCLYHDQGDTIALQYGGSHLVNTTETYRKNAPWTSHSRDMIESIRRHYSNIFTDKEKQDVINLFLGIYKCSDIANGSIKNVWDIDDDWFLHNESWQVLRRQKKNYIKWFDHKYLQPPEEAPQDISRLIRKDKQGFRVYDDGTFYEHYKLNMLTSFSKSFAFNMLSSLNVSPRELDNKHDFSPFKMRITSHSTNQFQLYSLNLGGVRRDLSIPQNQAKDSVPDMSGDQTGKQTGTDHLDMLLEPVVSSSELKEYKRYVMQFKPSQITPQPSSRLMRPLQPTSPVIENVTRRPPTPPLASDLAIFKSFVSTPALGYQPRSTRDYVLYETYASMAQRNWATNAGARTKAHENYDLWLRTGRLPRRRDKNVK